jgi:endonuclease IV
MYGLTCSVAVAKTNVFQKKNEINVGKRFAKILKIFDNINHIKNCGVIYSYFHFYAET